MNRRVLIVEPDSGLRGLLARFFEERGFAGDTAVDEREALAQIWEKDYDLIVTEDQFDAGNGLDLIGKLRLAAPNAKLVAITEFASPEELRRAGADNCIRKPFYLDELEFFLKLYFRIQTAD